MRDILTALPIESGSQPCPIVRRDCASSRADRGSCWDQPDDHDDLAKDASPGLVAG